MHIVLVYRYYNDGIVYYNLTFCTRKSLMTDLGLYWVFRAILSLFCPPFIFQMIVLSDIENKSHTLRTCANKKPPMRHASKAQIVHLSKFHVP